MAPPWRPKGTVVPELSLAPGCRPPRRALLGANVPLAKDTYGEDAQAKVATMNDGDVVLLENVRFNPEGRPLRTPTNAPLTPRRSPPSARPSFPMASAWSTALRAPTTTLPPICRPPQTAVEKEVKALSRPPRTRRPFTVVLGGSKVSDKLGVIENLLDKANRLVIGGGMVFTFLKAKGYEVGTSLA